MSVEYPGLAFFIVSIILTIIGLCMGKYVRRLAWLTSGAFLLYRFLASVEYYNGIDLRGIVETAVSIPIAIGIYFLIVWLGRRRARKQDTT
jgi:uncharacterized membrane protein YccC